MPRLSPPGRPLSPHPRLSTGATGGPNADASAIGWLGNGQGATACLGGSFYAPNGINTTYRFGIPGSSTTTWTNADGYLPALVTSFASGGAQVSITNFGDRVVLGGHPYVLIYSRVAVHNPTSQSVTVNPQPTQGLVPLNTASSQVAPGADGPTTTTWWRRTGSAEPTPGHPRRSSRARAATTRTSRTCGPSGTHR